MADGEFISVNSDLRADDGRSSVDFMGAFVTLKVMAESEVEIDMARCINILRQNSFISRNMYEDLLHRVSTFVGPSSDRIQMIFTDVFGAISFDDLITALRLAGYSRLAEQLVIERGGLSLLSILYTDTTNSEHMNKFYTSLKSQLSSGIFLNKLGVLDSLAISFRTKASSDIEERARQRALDKLAIVMCLQVNCLSDREAKQGALSNLKEDIPCGLGRQYVDLVICIGMCMTERKFGNYEAAQYHLDEAKAIHSVFNDPFFGFLICHTQHLLFRTMYAKNPTSHNFKKSLVSCHLGMSRAVPEQEETRQTWTETFTVFAALLLLQIGQEFEIPTSDPPAADYIKDAEEIMQASKNDSGHWGPRRDMMYNLVMARIKETSDISEAMAYSKKAMAKAKVGAYTKTEQINLKSFHGRLQSRITV